MTGSYTDGPEWGEQPYTNMFSSDLGSVDPSYPVNTLEGKILRQIGGTVLGSYGYSISRGSSREAGQEVKSFEHAERQVGCARYLGAVRRHELRRRRSPGEANARDGLVPHDDRRLRLCPGHGPQASGVKLKSAVFATGYAPGVVNSPSWSYLQGDEFLSIYRPFSLPQPGTEQMAAALQKYQHFSKSQFQLCSSTRAGRVPI